MNKSLAALAAAALLLLVGCASEPSESSEAAPTRTENVEEVEPITESTACSYAEAYRTEIQDGNYDDVQDLIFELSVRAAASDIDSDLAQYLRYAANSSLNTEPGDDGYDVLVGLNLAVSQCANL
jgi:PBP1b-binding outer membrane lipoprotein LpoB